MLWFQVIADADADILGIQEVRYEEIKGEELGPSQIQTLTEWFPEYQVSSVRYEEIKGEELGPSQIQTLTEWFPKYQVSSARYEEIKGEELGHNQIQTLTEWFPEYKVSSVGLESTTRAANKIVHLSQNKAHDQL